MQHLPTNRDSENLDTVLLLSSDTTLHQKSWYALSCDTYQKTKPSLSSKGKNNSHNAMKWVNPETHPHHQHACLISLSMRTI